MVLVLRSVSFCGTVLRCRVTPTLHDFSIRIAKTRDVLDSFPRDDMSSSQQMQWNYPSVCLNLHESICAETARADQSILCQKDRVCVLSIWVTPNSTQNHSIGNMKI